METGLKIGLAVAVFAAGWAGGLMPLRRGVTAESRLLSWGNAFAAGIFLAIGLVHMLADANDSWSDDLGYGYPMAFTLAGSAFALILLLEHVVVATGGTAHEATVVTSLHERPEVYPYALIVALSVHSILAGMALGAQDRLGNIMIIFAAIIAHKSSAAFALGVSFVRGGLDHALAMRLMTAFTLTTPVGVVLGTAISGALDGRTELYFDSTFTALAAGTFVYIASVDLIREEFLHGGARWQKWLLFAAAYAGTAVLAVWV